MKKLILILAATISSSLTMRATDNLVVPNLTISKGGEGIIDIQLNNELPYVTFAFTLNLPEGINYVDMELSEERLAPQAGSYAPIKDPSDDGRTIGLGSLGITENSIAGNSGTLFTVKVTADESLEKGTILNASITGIKFSTNDDEKTLDDVAFTITIGAPADTRTLFSETSTTIPEAANGVDVRVKRTIKANEWSTICLPFAMTDAQVKAAFGEDVELADFTGCETTYDNEENITAIAVNFDNATAIEANHPYIIKVSTAMDEFTVDGVNVAPEEEVSVDRDEYKYTYKIGNKTYTGYLYNRFVGTYVANTTVPQKALFLNGNKFWYSTGATTMKGFRAYFEFYEWLPEMDDPENKVRIIVNGETTAIEGIASEGYKADDKVYNVSGVYVGTADKLNSLPTGMYIVNGTKVMVK